MATLKVEIRESVKLDNNDYNSYNFHTISNINDISRRKITLTTTESAIIAMDNTLIGAGTYVENSVRYIRVTNLSKEFPVVLTLKNDDTDEVKIKIDKQASFIYTGEAGIDGVFSGSGVQNSFDADNDVIGSTDNLGDLVNITAYTSASVENIELGDAGSGSGVVKAGIELFVASI
tara:strand:+ start:211 stop:738 length:528 start_codon:yes stop_codon:yes gene_type:complete